MRPEVYIAGVGGYFPEAVPVDEAIANGDYSTQAQEQTGQRRVAIAGEDDTLPTMAVQAGRRALDRSRHGPGDVGLLLHAATSYNGLDGWNIGSYLQKEILDGAGLSFEVRQLSNGSVGSVELAARYLAATPETKAAMITAADQFTEPYWNRWTSNMGMVFGDGASAAVLSRQGGFARVLSVVTETAPELEPLHRGSQPFQPGPAADQFPVSLWMRSLECYDEMDPDDVAERMVRGLCSSANGAAEEAGMAIGDAARYVVPSFGRELVDKECLGPLGIDVDRTTWDWGMDVGHCGTADHFGGLSHLAESGHLNQGDRVMLISVGGGFNWTTVVLEILDSPDHWAAK